MEPEDTTENKAESEGPVTGAENTKAEGQGECICKRIWKRISNWNQEWNWLKWSTLATLAIAFFAAINMYYTNRIANETTVANKISLRPYVDIKFKGEPLEEILKKEINILPSKGIKNGVEFPIRHAIQIHWYERNFGKVPAHIIKRISKFTINGVLPKNDESGINDNVGIVIFPNQVNLVTVEIKYNSYEPLNIIKGELRTVYNSLYDAAKYYTHIEFEVKLTKTDDTYTVKSYNLNYKKEGTEKGAGSIY
jgi:hypothetical protein